MVVMSCRWSLQVDGVVMGCVVKCVSLVVRGVLAVGALETGCVCRGCGEWWMTLEMGCGGRGSTAVGVVVG